MILSQFQLLYISTIFLSGKVITKDDLFEGDILLTQNSKKLVDGDISFDAVISNSRKWTKAVVPYVFAYNFGKDFFILFSR